MISNWTDNQTRLIIFLICRLHN